MNINIIKLTLFHHNKIPHWAILTAYKLIDVNLVVI